MDEIAFTFNEKIGRVRAGSIEMDERKHEADRVTERRRGDAETMKPTGRGSAFAIPLISAKCQF
jgi:hypothetical protein